MSIPGQAMCGVTYIGAINGVNVCNIVQLFHTWMVWAWTITDAGRCPYVRKGEHVQAVLSCLSFPVIGTWDWCSLVTLDTLLESWDHRYTSYDHGIIDTPAMIMGS